MLHDMSLLKTRCLVNGKWIEAKTKATFPVLNPATGELIAEIPVLSPEEIPAVIEYSRIAQKKWALFTAKERSNILRHWF